MNESIVLNLLSGGAAQGLVGHLATEFESQTGCAIHGQFGAVGMMKNQLLSGAPCDVIILTDALIAELVAGGQAVAGSARALGTVQTGMAVKAGEAMPDVSSPEALKAALLGATAIYFPDAVQSTAGIHFMKVLKTLGVDAALSDRLHTYPNGAAAMAAMAQTGAAGALGCTQQTEILNTAGVTWAAPLPPDFALATLYTAAVCSLSARVELASQFVDRLGGTSAASLRKSVGFTME